MADGILGVLTAVGEIKAANPNVEFVYKDLGAKKIGERLNELHNLALTIGFQGATALELYPDGKINVATVALYNEFGTPTQPARPFMRRTVDENIRVIQSAIEFAFAEVVALRAKPVEAMAAIGRIIAEAMAETIDKSPTWATGNRPSTIASKGFDHPLIETGLMKKSITWAVRSGGALGSIVRQGSL